MVNRETIMSGEQYDEDYFLRGKQTGKSLYEGYRWMPEATLPMVGRMVEHLGIRRGETVLDFGCARGYVVRAFRELGHDAMGTDISEWAIANADESVRQYLVKITDCFPYKPAGTKFDWVIAKDVLEHVNYVVYTIRALMDMAQRGVFAVVPLSLFDSSQYVIPDYEKDVTHVQRHRLGTWADMFLRDGWSVEFTYRVRGIKDNWYKPGWERGNGFITARRLA